MDFPNVNNKLAFFDFDRTLVAHTYSRKFMDDRKDNYLMECVHMLTALGEEHMKDRPLPCMQWYAGKLYGEGYGLYCLTHEIFNLRDSIKQEQLKLFYPGISMAYLTVDIPEHKIDMMKAVAMVEGCSLSDIIFVDDRMDTVNLALDAGIDAKHLSDIVVMYEEWQDHAGQADRLVRPKSFGDFLEADPSLAERMTAFHDMRAGSDISGSEMDRIYREFRAVLERDHMREQAATL